MVYLKTTYELCLEAYFKGVNADEYFESCDFPPRKYKYRNLLMYHISVFMFDLRMINLSSECKYDWYWEISACSTEYEACDSFALAHTPTNFIFLLSRLIFSVSINSHPDNIYAYRCYVIWGYDDVIDVTLPNPR